MKVSYSFLILFFFFETNCIQKRGEKDYEIETHSWDTSKVVKYGIETKQLESQGKYQEALERHIWFHRHADETFGGDSSNIFLLPIT